MGLTAYHRPIPHVTRSPASAVREPAVCVFFGRGGLEPVDALVLNDLAAGLLAVLAGVASPDPAALLPLEVELLHDPQPGEIGIRPWAIGRPASTVHMVHPTRFRGGADPEWGDQMRAAWPLKIEAPQFLAFADVPVIYPHRPAAATIRDDVLVFSTGRLVTA